MYVRGFTSVSPNGKNGHINSRKNALAGEASEGGGGWLPEQVLITMAAHQSD